MGRTQSAQQIGLFVRDHSLTNPKLIQWDTHPSPEVSALHIFCSVSLADVSQGFQTHTCGSPLSYGSQDYSSNSRTFVTYSLTVTFGDYQPDYAGNPP